LHHLKLSLEDPGGILVLVGPLEPDWHRYPLEFFEIFDGQAIDLRAGFLEFATAKEESVRFIYVRWSKRGCW